MTATHSQAATDLDVANFIEERVAEHALLAGARLARLRMLACEAAEASAGIAELARMDHELAQMDHRMACFCNDLTECFRREEQMVFPTLLRLREQTHITSCKAGMVAARLRFMVAEQQALHSALADVIGMVERNLSPAGPCESCHQLLHEAKAFVSDLAAHVRREQDELFTWGVSREAVLVQGK